MFNERGTMTATVLDHVTDVNGAELHRLAKLYDLPDFVKQADTDVLTPANLPVSVYADPRVKLYPCNNPASTFLSCLFFAEKQGSYSPGNRKHVQERLDQLVEYWGIEEPVRQMRAKHADMHRDPDSLLPDSDFAYVRILDSGQKDRHWRIKNAKEVKLAAQSLYENRDHPELPFSFRRVIADKILVKAAAYGASLGEHEGFVERQAGHGVCNPDEVVDMIGIRVKLAKDNGQRQLLTKLASTVNGQPSSALTPDMLVYLADTMDAVDRSTKLAGRYTDSIKRPEDVIFSVTYKEASASVKSVVALTTGSIYEKGQFSKLSADDLTSLFGKDLANQVTTGMDIDPEKLAEVAATLPRGNAEMFEQLLKESGIPPMAHKSASDMDGISPTMMESLAKHYRK